MVKWIIFRKFPLEYFCIKKFPNIFASMLHVTRIQR